MIEYIIDYLKHHGFKDLVMLISDNESQLLQNQLGDGSRFGVNVEYSIAHRLGTAGALDAARGLLGERFVVYYGDVLTSMDLSAMVRLHEQRKAVCTLALSAAVPIEYGLAKVNQDGRVTYFEEKPVLKEYPVSMGIEMLDHEVLSYCKPYTDIAKDVIPRLVKENKGVYAYLTEKRHFDIGTFKALEEVKDLLEKGELFQR